MAVIVGLGFSFYAAGKVFLDNLYSSALGADQNLLSEVGISLSSISKGEIQGRIDDKIQNYTNILNSQSRVLLQLKDSLNNVDAFHKTLKTLDGFASKTNGELSFAYLGYNEKAATFLTFEQFRAQNNSGILDFERNFFEKAGYRLAVEKPSLSSWYKASNERISLSGGN